MTDMSEVVSTEEKQATQLPNPTGYRMLCALPEVEDKFANGLFKPDSLAKLEEFSTVVLFVIKQGPDCYKDTAKFPTGPWCKEGDFVRVPKYGGDRWKVPYGNEEEALFVIFNDLDIVGGVVGDPLSIKAFI